jgi:hypothetical protein
MEKQKRDRIRWEINQLRSRIANIRSRELISLAKKLGRSLFPRGKHPTYVSDILLNRPPLSIPNHSGALPKYTAESILNILEEDLDIIDEKEEK